MIDEIEKALSGVGNSGATDSGVSAWLFGTFLTWLNDHRSDMSVVCTCNDISKLPPEFARAEETAILVQRLPPARLPDTGLPSRSAPVRAKQPSAASNRTSQAAAGVLLLLATCCLCCAVPSLLQQTLSNLSGTVCWMITNRWLGRQQDQPLAGG
jgi:hypothetical protein